MADGGAMQGDMAISPDGAGSAAFRAALGRFATGVTLVTTEGPDGPTGFTANSFASVSLDPPLVLWSPARSSTRFAAFANAAHFSIHILADDQIDLTRRFARGGTGFSDIPMDRNAEGTPLLRDALARFDCVQHTTHDGGDHLIILGRVLRFVTHPGRPLIFSQSQYGGFAAQE